jgi:hypothetical protein
VIESIRDFIKRKMYYPSRDGSPIKNDPTYGRIDRDIQWRVNDRLMPTSIAMRVAMENTLQDKRNRWRRR